MHDFKILGHIATPGYTICSSWVGARDLKQEATGDLKHASIAVVIPINYATACRVTGTG